MRRSAPGSLMHVTVLGTFDNLTQAEEARRALIHAGVPEARIAIDVGENGGCLLGVGTQSSFERERIKALLQRNGASCTERQSA